MNIVGTLKIHNEVKKGNLERCLDNMSLFCNEVIVYDDGSTDNSVDIAKKYSGYVIEGKKNDFIHEQTHRKILLDEALKLKPDWIFWLDADEILEKRGVRELKKMIATVEACSPYIGTPIDSFMFHEINLWRSPNWYRTDSQFGDGWFIRLWKNTGELSYNLERRDGRLHVNQFPQGLKCTMVTNLNVIHYGFSTIQKIIEKYRMYINHGMTPEQLFRFIDESNLQTSKVDYDWFDTVSGPKPKSMEVPIWQRLIQGSL